MNIPKTCTHIKLDGEACRALALTGRRRCHYHERYSDRNTVPKNKYTYALVPFEDTRSILFTINQLIYSFINDLIDESKFTKTIYALQVAAQFVNRTEALSPDAMLEQAEYERAEHERSAAEAAGKDGAKQTGNQKDAEEAYFESDVHKFFECLTEGANALTAMDAERKEEQARLARIAALKKPPQPAIHDAANPASPISRTNRHPSS